MKRYRAKRDTKIPVLEDGFEPYTVWEGYEISFNPDDFEEVEEEKEIEPPFDKKYPAIGVYTIGDSKQAIMAEYSFYNWTKQIIEAVNKLKKGREL